MLTTCLAVAQIAGEPVGGLVAEILGLVWLASFVLLCLSFPIALGAILWRMVRRSDDEDLDRIYGVGGKIGGYDEQSEGEQVKPRRRFP